jgi:hypothetical protein
LKAFIGVSSSLLSVFAGPQDASSRLGTAREFVWRVRDIATNITRLRSLPSRHDRGLKLTRQVDPNGWEVSIAPGPAKMMATERAVRDAMADRRRDPPALDREFSGDANVIAAETRCLHVRGED